MSSKRKIIISPGMEQACEKFNSSTGNLVNGIVKLTPIIAEFPSYFHSGRCTCACPFY